MAFSALSNFKNSLSSQLGDKINAFRGGPQITLIADRVYTMPLPKTDGKTKDLLADTLKSEYGEHFMVWNLSEKAYNYDLFDNQVLEFKFPGHPCPPLNVLIQLIKSIRSWLEADSTNIAIVHCATGHIRTATVVACYLSFCGICSDVRSALAHYYQVLKIDHEAVTIPSQLRYIEYFSQVQGGFDPKERTLQLQCIVANEMPSASEMPPVIQIFQHGTPIFSSANKSPEHFATGSISFPVDCSISGDVLIRCRQPGAPNPQGKRTMHSLFRLNLHTAFIGEELLRLPCEQLDGPHKETSWPRTMFVDLIFAQSGVSEPQAPISPKSNVWKVAREQQQKKEELAAQQAAAATQAADADILGASSENYETYKPYSRRASADMDDEIAKEIAGAAVEAAADDDDRHPSFSDELRPEASLTTEQSDTSSNQLTEDNADVVDSWEAEMAAEMEGEMAAEMAAEMEAEIAGPAEPAQQQTDAEKAAAEAAVVKAAADKAAADKAAADKAAADKAAADKAAADKAAADKAAADKAAADKAAAQEAIIEADGATDEAETEEQILAAEIAAAIDGGGGDEMGDFMDEFGDEEFDDEEFGDDDEWMKELEAELENTE